MQRTILAVLASAFLVSAAAMWLFLPDSQESLAMAFCWRMGLVVTAAWLAFEDIQRLPGWLVATLPILAIILVRWPRYLLILLPIVVALAFFHSRIFRR